MEQWEHDLALWHASLFVSPTGARSQWDEWGYDATQQKLGALNNDESDFGRLALDATVGIEHPGPAPGANMHWWWIEGSIFGAHP